MESSSTIPLSPSFTCHSSTTIADTADRVIQELRTDNAFDDDDDDIFHSIRYDQVHTENEEDQQEFEFSSSSADEIFSNGDQIYPIFDTSLLLDPEFNPVVDSSSSETDSKPSPVVRLSLRKLFSEDRDSSSSSDADDLDRITPGTYCVWRPKTESTGKHEKSYSSDDHDTSKRWKVRDLLKRISDDNYSTAKDTSSFLLFTPTIATKTNNKKKNEGKRGAGYRCRPYLPYRHDQVPVFASFNRLSRDLHRF